MKIFDCFMYFDEDLVLDVRLNLLDSFVDKFIIIESKYDHKGEKREPLFDIKKFKRFEKQNFIADLENKPKKLWIEITKPIEENEDY